MGVQWLYNCKEGEEVVLGVLPFFHRVWHDGCHEFKYYARIQNGSYSKI